MSEATAMAPSERIGIGGVLPVSPHNNVMQPECKALDAADPLAAIVAQFAPGEPDVLYFDANSIGAMPLGAERAMARLGDQWRHRAFRAERHRAEIGRAHV